MKIIVGQGSCGIAAGANKVYAAIEGELKKRNLEAQLTLTGCIGMCYLEPIIDVINDEGKKTTYVMVTPEMVEEIIEASTTNSTVEKYNISENDQRILEKQQRIALRNCGMMNPENIDEYIDRGGYKAAEECITNKTPQEVIEEIKVSGLRGRGGAGFPTWFKWNAAQQSPGNTKYIICNADEGDPGAFMDRSILEGDPHSIIEGMLIGGYAMGATEGVIYVRAEYPLAIVRLKKAIEQARERGYLGKNIFGEKRFQFDMRIKAGAGAFVCGEETALIASLEGERGMPRLKPPFPAQKGYWDKPSNINNVETLANVPWILANGGKAFAAMGTEQSKGTKVFALTGKIKKGGLVEVPMGIPLKEVIFDIGGGIINDKTFKAVQMGGPSGGCIPHYLLDTPVDYDSIMKTGAIMGSGGMVVMDETTCMVDMARFFLDFTRKESCGKCIHCRIGTKRMLEILTRLCEGEGKDGDIELLEELGIKIKEGSLCGLGQTAPNPVLSTIQYFREEYEKHIYDKKCPAKQCSNLLTFTILENCIGCGLCARNCPADAIIGERKEVHNIIQEKCVKCGKCEEVCKFGAVEIQ
ncbi:NAD(P)-dependent iron-only hydrogenase diaphorase component flavoprotein NuoF [Clostridium aceticum]|uniref:NAD(P)-dependent iron-only hydrogenase diaphorase component flavoprotein NuoF n=1 Tax=Clostridium aceticum TaxID=84022 RepID=A0A0D8IEN6_9CLOT|nr:NADH-quinone oxidoreductase subunit NuoF [Clostridium aceticum]AKL94234.1 NAD(P)-dependent iron-only hydrogenase diaphorase component flavoprotein NuoF [Clostridium aceticum]KJF28432.1 NADH dehydrogenase [Clostridium aceticum]